MYDFNGVTKKNIDKRDGRKNIMKKITSLFDKRKAKNQKKPDDTFFSSVCLSLLLLPNKHKGK